MKKLLVVFLSVLTALCFAGCTYTPATTPDITDPNKKPGEVTDNDFTVTLVCENEKFIPETEMSAIWSDGVSLKEAAFDETGKASAGGLDGDYNVTLKGVPDGYTYNPNVYVADNDNRDVTIELYKLINFSGDGSDLYRNIIRLNQLGAYRIIFTEKYQQIYCQYKPEKNGEYAIESIMDTNADEINPRLDVYWGTDVWKPEKPTQQINTGGASSVYTKNFRYEKEITEQEIGQSSVFAFALNFDCRLNEVSVENPVYIDFIITRDGDFEYGTATEIILPKEDFKQTPEYDRNSYTYVNFGERKANGRILLDGSKVGYSDPKSGGDGYYHLLNEDGTISDTILYTCILGNNMEDFTDPQVGLTFNGKNYNYLIRGYSMIIADSDGVPFDLGFIGSVGGELYFDVLSDDVKDRITELEKLSYKDYANSDGVYAVTQELKDFLLAYSIKSTKFFDGTGWAEDSGYDSSDADQWLLACGYYVKI